MKTLGWLVALVGNFLISLAFIQPLLDAEAPLKVRAISAAIALVSFTATTLLILAKASRIPTHGLKIMRYLCFSIPVLWLLGSLDYGIISGQEFLSSFFVALISWGTWHAFILASRPA